MKKTRTQGRGREGCESQLEEEKARNTGANRNPRTEVLEIGGNRKCIGNQVVFPFVSSAILFQAEL